MRSSLALTTLLAVLAGCAEACSWSSCRNSVPNCVSQTGIPDSFYSGRTTRSAAAWDWNFCGLAWEEKYECCWTPRPTPFPTPKPTPFPTNFPTPFPTNFPTQDPTRFPSASPTTPKPSVNPTVSPTPPTPFPTKAPTIAVPSAAPTVPLDLCGPGDIATFESNKRNFDKDITICGVYCSLDVLRDPEEVIGCMKKCHSDVVGVRRPTLRMPPFDPVCAFCFGRYAECMLNTCGCPGGRPFSQDCTDCSLGQCEKGFTNCTGGMVIAPYTDGFPVPETDENTLMLAALGAFGGLVALSGAAGLYMYRQRLTRDPSRASSLRLSTFLGKSPIASKVIASENPLHGTRSGPTPTALGGMSAEQMAAAALAATVAAAAIASAGAKLTVVHSFEGNPEYDDELTVAEGDELEFVELVGDDNAWMSCVNPATGKEGIIPTVNVKFNAQT